MLTRHDVKVGDRVTCVSLHSSEYPDLNTNLEDEGIRLGKTYTVELVSEYEDQLSCIGLKQHQWIPMDIFVRAQNETRVTYNRGQQLRLKVDVSSFYVTSSLAAGEVVTVTRLHEIDPALGMLEHKSGYYDLSDPDVFQPYLKDQDLRDLLAELKSVPDPKLDGLAASKRLGVIIDTLEEKLKTPA